LWFSKEGERRKDKGERRKEFKVTAFAAALQRRAKPSYAVGFGRTMKVEKITRMK